MSYSSQSNVENLLKRELLEEEENVLDLVFDVVDKYIDEKVGGSFGIVTATTKLYDGNGERVLDIDPCTDVTVVEALDNDGDVIKTYDLDVLRLRPINDTVKRWIELLNYGFIKGVANIRVTAKFSLGAVPSDIEYLATYLATKYFSDYITGNLKSESIEGYSRTFGEMGMNDFVVKSVLDKYTSDTTFF